MRSFYFAFISSCLIVLSACSVPKQVNVDASDEYSNQGAATIKGGVSNIWYIIGFCGTDAHVVAIDGKALPQFKKEKRNSIGLPENPDFDYSIEVLPGKHEFIVALQRCHLIAYQVTGCALERIGSCHVNVGVNQNYLVKGFGCSPEKGVNFINLDTNEVIKECKEFSEVSSPWVYKSLSDFLNKNNQNN